MQEVIMQRFDNIHDVARGKWPSLLPAFGVPAALINGKHQPCPMCGGKDRFRFTDHEGSGAYICNQCGKGNGVDLVMKLKGLSFKDVATEIREKAGTATQVYTKATATKKDFSDYGRQLWATASPLTEGDAGMLYLRRRGITFVPKEIRLASTLRTKNSKGVVETAPFALVSRFVGPDNKTIGFHRTFLTADGQKARMEKTKMFAPGSIPEGGSVRLANSAETMGIAEGIETVLSAMQMFDIPVWAACDAGRMLKWRPPATCKNVIVFADNDSNFTGQLAAYGLAAHLIAKGYAAEVRMPDFVDCDWNDTLMSSVETRSSEAS
jgi:putative DNA primase/helicase